MTRRRFWWLVLTGRRRLIVREVLLGTLFGRSSFSPFDPDAPLVEECEK